MSNKNSYPFRTKAQILAQLSTDDTFVIECLGILYNRQTSDEQERHDTKYKNRRGFMSSHAVNGCLLVEKMMRGEGWTPEESDKALAIVSRYGRQLATHFRAEQIKASPDLATQAACFFTTTAPVVEPVDAVTEITDEDLEA
jgi:hypothetical protein